MIFNSLAFVAFFLVVYSFYVTMRHRAQNYWLLAASYVFYGMWDWRFLGLIWISTVVDFVCGGAIHASSHRRRRRALLAASIAVNLGILFAFKYFNFFAEGFNDLASIAGLSLETRIVNVVLPVGISFYTFQTMSYTIDIYREKIEPTRDLASFALFVAYFPQLVAGPIERARVLLPQIAQPRTIRYQQIKDGAWLIVLGYYKKLVIADNMTPFVRPVFDDPHTASGTAIVIAVYAAAFQIYGDFSGYSDIARGISKLMGIELMQNFARPYFATNPSDFWRRWHISLSTWLRDYLYISLGGSRKGAWTTYRNLMLTMLLGGLWHGAAWNFVAWGAFHGGILALHRAARPWLADVARIAAPASALGHVGRVVFFFHVTCVGWLVFFVHEVSHVPLLVSRIFEPFSVNGLIGLVTIVVFAGPLLAFELLEERGMSVRIRRSSRPLRLAAYATLVTAIVLCGALEQQPFIYFQF